MSRAIQIYPIQKNIKRELSKIERDPYNREILTRYYKVRCSQIQPATVLYEILRLNILSRMLNKKFEDASVQDIEDLNFQIDQWKNKPNTKNKFRKVLKSFYRWLRGYPKKEFPPEVKWIELKKVPLVTVEADDLPSFEDCVRIAESALNLRDKALLLCYLDAGCRIGEILTAKIGEVKFNDYGAVIDSDGKTGQAPCILTWSAKILATWLNNHPFRHMSDAPLWPILGREHPQQLSYDSVRMIFRDCVKRAGYTKRVWLHLFKHVSCTRDSDLGMPDAYMRYKYHWTPDSPMPKVYQHLSQSIIPKIQNVTWNGFGKPDDEAKEVIQNEKPTVLIKTCRRCQYENPRDSFFCNRCGFALDDKVAAEKAILRSRVDHLLDKLTEDPQKLDRILAVIAE